MRILTPSFASLWFAIGAACSGGGAAIPDSADLPADPGAGDLVADVPAATDEEATAPADPGLPDLVPADPGGTDAADPGGSTDVPDTGLPLPDGFIVVPKGFSGVAGRLTSPALDGPAHPPDRKVSLILGTGAGAKVLATALTDAAGTFRIDFPEDFVPAESMALRLEADIGSGPLVASYSGPLVDIDPASDAAAALEPRFPALSYSGRAFLADFARALGGTTGPFDPVRLRPFASGLAALLGTGGRTGGADPVKDYVLSVESFKQELALFCATTDFSKAEVAAFLSRFEPYAAGFLSADAWLDATATPSAMQVALRKMQFELDLMVFLWMVADLADDNLAEGFETWKAVHYAQAYCGYMLRTVPAVTLWAPELALEADIAAAAEIEIPEDVPVDPDDLVEAGIQPPQTATIEFVFVHPMAVEASHLAGRALDACAWEKLKDWSCEVEKAEGATFACDHPQDDCCDQCDCYDSKDGCVHFIGCYTCVPPTGDTFKCYTQQELEANARFAIPLANAFVGLLVDVKDRGLLRDESGKKAFVDLYYDGVLVATTGGKYDMGPLWVGPPIDNPDLFTTVSDPMFELSMTGFAKMHLPEVLEKVRLVVGLPSEAAAGEHRSLFLESRGDPFNGLLLVWNLAIVDGPMALSGIRDTTKLECTVLAAPIAAVSQRQYLKGAMPFDLDALASATGDGLLQDHQLKAVLTLTNGASTEATYEVPAPLSKLDCPECEGNSPQGSADPGKAIPCKAVVGEDFAMQGVAQLKRIRNRLLDDTLDLATGEVSTALAEGAMDKVDELNVVGGLKTLGLDVEHLFESETLNTWVKHGLNRLGRFLDEPAGQDVYAAARQFVTDQIAGFLENLLDAKPPAADLPLDAPAWIENAQQYSQWKETVDNCLEALCPWANGNLRLLRQSMKAYGDGAQYAADTLSSLSDWADMASDTLEYGKYLRGLKVVKSGLAKVGPLGEYLALAKAITTAAEIPAEIYAMLVIGRKIEQGEQVINGPGAYKSALNPCGDPAYAIY
jgi:hypothetical protein